MGNCLKRQSQMIWAGDDWGTLEEEKLFSDEETKGIEQFDGEEKKNQMGDEKKGVSSSREVKIKISKKQLEELLGKVDVKAMSIEQVLSQLMTVSDDYSLRHRSWRPALHSIPEVN